MDYREYLQEKVDPAYDKGLTKKERKVMRKEIKTTMKKDDDDPKAYKKWISDKKFLKRDKTKESKFTKKYKELYGEEMLQESVKKSLKNKSEETGISYSILKQVFDRGMAAWKSGHRPGVSPHQWAMGRVNSFIVKGPTWKGPDKDLADKVRGK
jgi:hypothetical protein